MLQRVYPGAMAELSQMLLGPVSSELKKKRVLIVAEGVLQYVPLQRCPILPTPMPSHR
jgi:hypothetical protein